MALTTRAASQDDLPGILAVWNRRAADPNSCWSGIAAPSVAMIEQAAANPKFLNCVAIDDSGVLVGFAAWRDNSFPYVSLFGIAADTDAAFYSCARALATWGTAKGKDSVRARVAPRDTTEKTLWATLGTVYQQSDNMLAATCSLAAMLTALDGLGA